MDMKYGSVDAQELIVVDSVAPCECCCKIDKVFIVGVDREGVAVSARNAIRVVKHGDWDIHMWEIDLMLAVQVATLPPEPVITNTASATFRATNAFSCSRGIVFAENRVTAECKMIRPQIVGRNLMRTL